MQNGEEALITWTKDGIEQPPMTWDEYVKHINEKDNYQDNSCYDICEWLNHRRNIIK